MTRLSVNLNKIAVLRNSRGGDAPDVGRAAKVCLDAGAHGITVHPRPVGRHIRTPDVHALAVPLRQRIQPATMAINCTRSFRAELPQRTNCHRVLSES